MISFRDMQRQYIKRYGLNAAEAAENAKVDREMLNTKEDRHILSSIESYTRWMGEMDGSID